MKHVICKGRLKTDDRTYEVGEYANISDDLYHRYEDAMFQLIEDLPNQWPEDTEQPQEEV